MLPARLCAKPPESQMNMIVRELVPGAAVVDAPALETFQKQWAIYQRLVDLDILSHKAVAALLHGLLAEGFKAPFTFLDIACGDAHNMADILAGTAIAHYRGIDLSEPALALAAANLKRAPFDVELEHGDFVAAMAAGEPTDVAWCGLSVHHLKSDEKQAFLAAVAASTKQCCMIYEPTRLDDEDRDGYMRRFLAVYEAMGLLTRAELDEIEHHVTTCDFPETSAAWRGMALKAGFAKAAELYCDPTGFFRVYRFDKA